MRKLINCDILHLVAFVHVVHIREGLVSVRIIPASLVLLELDFILNISRYRQQTMYHSLGWVEIGLGSGKLEN